jgi:hypothetical protein
MQEPRQCTIHFGRQFRRILSRLCPFLHSGHPSQPFLELFVLYPA